MTANSIESYLLKEHLKPLYIFTVDTEATVFGVFAGNKNKVFPTDLLIWNEGGNAPEIQSEIPLWVLPLMEKDGKYILNYNFSSAFFSQKNISMNHGNIKIFDQKNKASWDKYNNLDPQKPLQTIFELDFEAKWLSVAKVTSFNITEKKIQDRVQNKIEGWLFTGKDIGSTDTLLKFDGLICEIVDDQGRKNDYHIWCGIRPNSKKVFLSINNSEKKDETIGTDCPLVWTDKGFVDDTLFSFTGKEMDTFSLKGNKLWLKESYKDGILSADLASVIIDPEAGGEVEYNTSYAWLIKEKDEKGKVRLFPFFKRINKNLIIEPLDQFLIRPSGFNLLYFFQINRFDGQSFKKSIISWMVAELDESPFLDMLDEVISSRGSNSKAGPESITPQFEKKTFKKSGQILLEHSIIGDKVSFDFLKILKDQSEEVSYIEKLEDFLLTKQTINFPNLRGNKFDRRKLTLGNNDKILFENLKLNGKNVVKSEDNGTLFCFNIEPDAGYKARFNGMYNDGSFSFELDPNGRFEGKMYFSLQLQKAQKPFYFWEWYRGLAAIDSIVPCYEIENFNLPVKKVTPLSTDLSSQDRYIADDDSISIGGSGMLRPVPPLIIPLTDPVSREYSLLFSENINVGQDYFASVELQVRNPKESEINDPKDFGVVVLGSQPQTAVKIETPFGADPQSSSGTWIAARKNSLSADGNTWEIFNQKANEEGITVTFPPQAMGEAFRKTDGTPMDGEPQYNTADAKDATVAFKFSPPAKLQIANEKLNRQMVTVPWNLRYLFGSYGDSDPGLKLHKAQFELLYGMSADFENKTAFIAEIENKLGQLVKAPRGKVIGNSSFTQQDAFKKAYSEFARMLFLFNSRLAVYEVSSTQNKFQPARFDKGINYFFRVDEHKKGAHLKWPFTDTPEYLQEIHDKYHRKDGLAGGFHWGFESRAVYNEVMTQGLKLGSSSGEIENLAFTSLGGYGKQVARFANDKSIIKSTVSLGRTQFYAVERIGRIGVFWNKAKHVIEYERTVVPSLQFGKTENIGRAVVRKVREFIEILEPERKYPEFGGESFATGSVWGTHFKSIKIPVSSSWGRDVMSVDKYGNKILAGWEVPLWKKDEDHRIYPFPQIMLNVRAAKETGLKEILCNLKNPHNIYFYTDTREQVAERVFTAETNDWASVAGVDFTFQPFENIYLQTQPCSDYNDPKQVNIPLPSPVDCLPGFERFTFEVLPSDIPISANGAYNEDSSITAKLRTVTMQRKPKMKEEKIKMKGSESEQQQKLDFIKDSSLFLVSTLNGYKETLNTANQGKTAKVKQLLKQEIKDHLKLFGAVANGFDKVKNALEQAPALTYLTSNISSIRSWELPTIFLWNQTIQQLDASIGSVYRYYKITFDTLKKELFEWIDNSKIDQLTVKINELKTKIATADEVLDTQLKPFEIFIEKETGKLKEDSAELKTKLNEAKTEINQLLDNQIQAIENIADDLSIEKFKKEIENVLTELDEILNNIRVKINSSQINENVRNKVVQHIIKPIEDVKTKIKDALGKVKDTDVISDLKTLFVEKIKSFRKTTQTLFVEANNLINEAETFLKTLGEHFVNFKTGLKNKVREVQTDIDGYLDNAVKVVASLTDKTEIKNKLEAAFFGKKQELITNLTIKIQAVLTAGYDPNAESPAPPLAHLFNTVDKWIKDIITDFNTLIRKIGGAGGLEQNIEKYYEDTVALYDDYKKIEEAIRKGDKEALIRYTNQLSQAINQDFGKVVGKVTEDYYHISNVVVQATDLEKEIQNTLFNFRSVVEDIKAVDLGFNRQSMELIFNFKETYAPRLLITPVMGKLEKLNDSLSTMGVSVPYGALNDKFIAPLQEWGKNFGNSLAKKFPMSNLLKDISGFKFDNMLPFLKGNDSFYKAVKVESKVDEKAMKAWVKANLDYTFPEDNVLMNIGPLKVRLLRDARIQAEAFESVDIDRSRKSDSEGSLKATFEISLSGAPLMLFRDTEVKFKNGNYDFDLDPSRMEMPGLLKILSDASQQIKTSESSSEPGENGSSAFKMETLKYKLPNTSHEVPIGVKANLDLPPLSIGGGTTSISNLSFGGHFQLKAIDDTVPEKPKLDFNIGLGFYLGKKDLPFNFTAFILGGGGYIDCSFKYQPSVSTRPEVDFIMSVHGSAALAISAGWITGSVMILAGIEVEYNSGKRSTRIEMFVAIIGVVDILGLISVYLTLRLSINYQSNNSGTVLYGVGNVKVKIRICRFVTIKVNKNYTMVLKGKSKNVKNERSGNIAASLN